MKNYEVEQNKLKDVRHLASVLSQKCSICPLSLTHSCVHERNIDMSCYKLVYKWLNEESEVDEYE